MNFSHLTKQNLLILATLIMLVSLVFIWLCTDIIGAFPNYRNDVLEGSHIEQYLAELKRLRNMPLDRRAKIDTLKENIKKLEDLYRHLDLHSQVDDDVCDRYKAAGIRREFVHLFDVLEPNFADSYQHDIVYVSQMKWTPKKAGVLRVSIDAWNGPMSIAIFIEPQETEEFIHIMSLMMDDIDTSRVHIHLAMGQQEFYPVNYMRNIALNATKQYSAEYVYLIDIDFMGHPDLYSIFQKYTYENRVPEEGVLVVPAYQFLDTIPPMPRNKREFLKLYRDEIITPFHSNVNNIHKPTRYDIWVNAEHEYQINFKVNYEPYILIRSSQCPSYDERFFGRGGDKYSQLLEIYAMQFSFYVIPEGYIIHYPHPYTTNPPELPCGHAMLVNFMSDLERKYPLFQIPDGKFSKIPGWDKGPSLVHLE